MRQGERKFFRLLLVCTSLLGALAACQSVDMQKIASRENLYHERIASPLPMYVLERPQPADTGTLRVYLDGDGVPYRDGRPSGNPSARSTPLGLELFLRDPQAHAYLGRPCLFVQGPLPPDCDSHLWTTHRYSEEVVAALQQSLSHLTSKHDATGIELVGYSGGGTLALLLAGRRTDIIQVTTIAAPLDHAAWTRFHGHVPLSGSLNPLSEPRAGRVRERHLLGERDGVVPIGLAAPYKARYPQADFHVVEGFDHRCCWAAHWPELLEQLR
jgi:pimeloyl-ACP methyl ester carboxylesterase